MGEKCFHIAAGNRKLSHGLWKLIKSDRSKVIGIKTFDILVAIYARYMRFKSLEI